MSEPPRESRKKTGSPTRVFTSPAYQVTATSTVSSLRRPTGLAWFLALGVQFNQPQSKKMNYLKAKVKDHF